MKTRISTLSPRKHQAIAALITHSDAEAASICGISAQILGRWRKEPLFDAVINTPDPMFIGVKRIDSTGARAPKGEIRQEALRRHLHVFLRRTDI